LQIGKAKKLASGSHDRQALEVVQQNMASEKSRIAEESRLRAEEERQLAAAEERLRVSQAQVRQETQRQEEDSGPSTASQLLQLTGMIAQRYQANLATAAVENATRSQAFNNMQAQVQADLDRNQQRFAQQKAQIAADRQAREQANTTRLAAATVSQAAPVNTPSQYKPQHVIIPRGDLVCAAGYTWHDASGVGAPGGTCYKDSTSQGSARVGSNSGSSSDRQSSTSNTTTRQQTSTSSGNDTQSDQPTSTKPPKQPPKTEWGPIQLEALAICRKGEKSGKWWCDGPLQDDIIYDSPTVEDALSSVRCSGATSAAGGTTNKGKQADVYRCGYGLDKGDRNIAKIHGLVTSQRSYICPKYYGGQCRDFYDGQDKR